MLFLSMASLIFSSALFSVASFLILSVQFTFTTLHNERSSFFRSSFIFKCNHPHLSSCVPTIFMRGTNNKRDTFYHADIFKTRYTWCYDKQGTFKFRKYNSQLWHWKTRKIEFLVCAHIVVLVKISYWNNRKCSCETLNHLLTALYWASRFHTVLLISVLS